MQGNRRLTALAVATLWLLNGLVTGSLSAKLPELASGLNLSEGKLGLALLGQTIGLVIVMFTIADRLVHRFGSRRVAIAASALYCLSFIGPGQAGGLAALFAALLVIGVFNAPLDVTMGELAGELEERWQRRLMSRFEFAFNAGLVVAAGLAWVGANRVDLATYLTIIAGLGVVLTLAAAPLLPDSAPPPAVVTGPEQEPRRYKLTPAVWGMAALAVAALWCEATVLDWMGIFYVRTLEAEPAAYAIGLLCFVAGLMVSLWSGNRLADRFGPVVVVVAGATAFAAGLAVTLLAPTLFLADAGLALAGAGMANVHPLALSAARRAGGPSALARVGGTSYVGLVLAKPVIGGVAEVSSLRLALSTSVVVALSMIVCARVLRRPEGLEQPPERAPEVEAPEGELLLSYANRPGTVIVTADLSGSRYDLAGVTAALVAAVSTLVRDGTPVERVLVRVAQHTNPRPDEPGASTAARLGYASQGHIALDTALLERIRTAAGVEGIGEVGDPIVDYVNGSGWRAVIAVTLAAGKSEAALEACASAIARAVPELAQVLVCREAGGSPTH